MRAGILYFYHHNPGALESTLSVPKLSVQENPFSIRWPVFLYRIVPTASHDLPLTADGRTSAGRLFKGQAMLPSSDLCRLQQAYHRDRAAGTLLENIRRVSTIAAAAWGQEALIAAGREERQVRTRAVADDIALRKREATEEESRALSENPDRGFADIAI
ncbi:hypothetical protein [Sphingomonas quercus]|uniref:Uncharacterized protein n=1 Tax=Sphingomonas quercus TaxID=2842451 RepID=A0ABS6BIB5_9SPHN|nr:hypothetical protein [Sphingomonas quercus]MBU3077562.1 hypothetical protein [Sphingomonas quercus]